MSLTGAMAKTKIAHIITKLELGGAQKTTLSLLRHLDENDYEIHLITSPWGLLTEEAFCIQGLRAFLVPALTSELNPLKDIISFLQILRYLRRRNISIVHTHSSKAGIIGRWAGRFAGVRFIFHTVHGWPFHIETNILARFFYTLLEKITSWITTRLIMVSDTDLKAGLKYVNKNRAKYVRISYGIESREFFNTNHIKKSKDTRLVSSLNIREDACVVGVICCFKPQKAPLDFVKVAKAVIDKGADVQFLSIGDGILRPAAEKMSLELGLNGNIKFLGWRKDIPALLSVVDILLLTSRWEGMPVVFFEALASGVPIIATDVGGASEVVKDGINGFLEKTGACEKLAEDVLSLAGNPEKRQTFSKVSRENFRDEFDIAYMTTRIENVYEQSIKR